MYTQSDACLLSWDEIVHQDVKIRRRTKRAMNGEEQHYHTTGVHDRKFDDPTLDSVREDLKYYQNPETMLTDASLYGVVFSEMGKFSRRCSRKEDFHPKP